MQQIAAIDAHMGLVLLTVPGPSMVYNNVSVWGYCSSGGLGGPVGGTRDYVEEDTAILLGLLRGGIGSDSLHQRQ